MRASTWHSSGSAWRADREATRCIAIRSSTGADPPPALADVPVSLPLIAEGKVR